MLDVPILSSVSIHLPKDEMCVALNFNIRTKGSFRARVRPGRNLHIMPLVRDWLATGESLHPLGRFISRGTTCLRHLDNRVGSCNKSSSQGKL